MFSRSLRLARADFAAALKSRRRRSSAHFLAIAPEGLQGYAVVIPKKVVRRSVDRHRIKRQVLEILRALPSLPPSLVVFPRLAPGSVHYEEMKTELTSLISGFLPSA